jgi:hypothetical protein
VNRDVWRHGRLIASAAVAASMVLSTTAAWAQAHPAPGPGAGSSDPAPDRISIQPAPENFRRQLIDMYRPLPTMAAAYPSATPTQVPSAAVFERQIHALKQQDLDVLYSMAPGVWREIRAAEATVPRANGTHGDKTFSASSVTPELPPDPEERSCKTGETLVAERLAASSLERAADIIKAVIAIFHKHVDVFGVAVPNPLYVIPFTIAEALEDAAGGISLDVDLQEWCKSGNEFALIEYLSGDAPRLLFDFDQTLLSNYPPILAAIEAAKKQLEDRATTAEQHLAEAANNVKQIETTVDDSLHTQIEAALGGQGFSQLFLLPASKGGYLDSTPGGVKQIVTDALKAMLDNHQPVSSAGPRYLALANDKLAAGEYNKAFHFYQLAYQEIAKY